MRTTLDIDDDVLQAAKELAQREGRTAGLVISELARRGLAARTATTPPPTETTLRGGVPVLPSRGEVVTLEKLRQLREQEGV
jgi:hypothetical protein